MSKKSHFLKVYFFNGFFLYMTTLKIRVHVYIIDDTSRVSHKIQKNSNKTDESFRISPTHFYHHHIN